MSNALIAAIAGSLRAPPVVSAGITYVGSTSVHGSISSIALPAGCASGDYVPILVEGLSTTSFSLTGSGTLQALSQYTSSGTARVMGIFEYVLTSTDVTNGSLALVSNGSIISISVFRGVNATPVDQQSAMGTQSSQKPVTLVAAGVTTTVPNDMLVFFGTVGNLGGSLTGTWTQQSGFTASVQDQRSNECTTIAYAVQASAGPTGSVSATFSNNNFGQSAAVLIALKPA